MYLRADEHQDEVLFRYLATGDVGDRAEEWTYRDLDRRAREIAARLQDAGAEAERALLLFPPGLEFVAALFGCLYSRAVAVPCYPPDPARLSRSLPRLQAIAEDSAARLVLTTSSLLSLAQHLYPRAPQLAALRWIATDEPDAGLPYREPSIAPDDIAFLQYTSGSTGTPKGVMVSHANVMHNERQIAGAFRHGRDSVGVGWLPLYHDMGLIGNVLQPLYTGFPCTLMSPLDFLKRPARWLEAISHYRATTSGGPNFAYELCVRKIPDSARGGLDLTSWELAFNGAEPVRAATLDRFSAAFEPCGFRKQAFYPCYGLAEATLLVTGGRKGDAIRAVEADARVMERGGRYQPLSGGGASKPLIALGRPWLGQTLAIVDPETHAPCPARQIGEIWVSGPSVARGYWNSPGESDRAFRARLRADAASSEAGRDAAFLRTGDLGFLDDDGQLYVTGRRKDLIIIRGSNHWPQDLELVAEASSPCVRSGCCAAFSVDAAGEEQVVIAAEVDARGQRWAEAGGAAGVCGAIRAAIAREHRLHVYAVVLLQPRTIPKTSSGKLQRHACREQFLSGSFDVVGESRAEPDAGGGGATEVSLRDELLACGDDSRRSRLIAFLVREAARLARVRPADVQQTDALLDLGLDSLTLVELHGDLEHALGASLPAEVLFQRASLADIADHILSRGWSAVVRAERSPAVGMTPGSLDGELPVSSGQRRLWFLDQLTPRTAVYNVLVGLRMSGPLDPGLLQASLTDVVARHAVLRSTFLDRDGRPHARVAAPEPVAMSRVALDGVPAPERESALREAAIAFGREPFDLARGPLLRARLFAMDDAEHVLALSVHHIVTDAWSLGILAEELAGGYEQRARAARGAEPAEHAAVASRGPACQFPDYARWEPRHLESLEHERAYWAETLAGLPPLELPLDRAPVRTPPSAGDALLLSVPAHLKDRLRRLCEPLDCTLFVVLASAYSILLHRYSGQDDFGVATIVANRRHPATRDMTGFFANTVAVRCRPRPDMPVSTFIEHVRDQVRSCIAHAALPFEHIAAAMGPRPDGLRGHPLQASFVFEDVPRPELRPDGMSWRVWAPMPDGSVPGGAKFDLSLVFDGQGAGDPGASLSGAIEYRADCFDRATIERMAAHLLTLLEGMAADPAQPLGRLPLLSAQERQQILVEWNDTDLDFPRDALVHELFEAQARRTPLATALVFEDQRLSYRELDERADQLARRLRALGVAGESRVGVCVRRSLDMVVALLGVIKAGAAYVPLDPGYPHERLRLMLMDSGVQCLICQRDTKDIVNPGDIAVIDLDDPAGEGAQRPSSGERDRGGCTSDSLMYIIYTSGSTGLPKGVMVSHRSVVNHVYATDQLFYPGLDRPATWLALTSISFDGSVIEIFWPLLRGFTVVVQGDVKALSATADGGGHGGSRRGFSVAAQIRAHRVTHVLCSPSYARLAIADSDTMNALTQVPFVLLGAEVIPTSVAQALTRDRPGALINVYGPTETTDWSTTHRVTDASKPAPIGVPIANTDVYVLDGYMQPTPINVAGELYIGGEGVARGYHNAPAMTAARFVSHPFAPGERLYRTGDRARWRADGTLEFLGRTDHQIKLRGHRIEPGEIEFALEQIETVRSAAVIAREVRPGDARLIAYVCPADPSAPPNARELRARLSERLPAYMVPAVFVTLDALPLTPSGKRARNRLPSPRWDEHLAEPEDAAPHTEVERHVVAIIQQVLMVTRVGLNDDFFSLGGDSLLAMQVVSRVREVFDLDLPVQTMFENHTVRGFARIIESQIGARITGEFDVLSEAGDAERGSL